MPLRFSIKWLLFAMAYVAVAAAAFKDGWWIWADLLWGVAWLAWGYAVLTATFRRGEVRAGALGFALLAGAYAFVLHFTPGTLPTTRWLSAVGIEATGDDLFGPAEPVDPSGPRRTYLPKLRAANSVGAVTAGLAGLCLGLLVSWQSQRGTRSAGGMAVLMLAALMASGAAYGEDGRTTYVDATDGPGGNTRLATGEDFVPRLAEVAEENDQWSLQLYGNEATVYTAGDGSSPPLMTTLTGLTPGERYHVLIYYWTVSGGGGIEASLTPPAASDIAAPKVTPPSTPEPAEATPDMFNAEVLVEEAGRQLTQMSLGEVAANDQGEIHVWIDDVPNSTAATRAWYDGVGYVEEPEPPPVEVGSLLDWWPWIVMLAVGFIVFIMIAARRRERGSMIDDATAT